MTRPRTPSRSTGGGWADIGRLLGVLGASEPAFRGLDPAKVVEWVRASHPDRFEVSDGRIRARYGHSAVGVVTGSVTTPPDRLYHGTDGELLGRIVLEGLRPMSRSAVHLTADLDYARSIAARFPKGVVLVVHAQAAADCGRRFLQASGHVWQVDAVPTVFLGVVPTGEGSPL